MTVKRKCGISFWLAAIPLAAGAANSLKSFLIKQISECTTKPVYVTSTTGRATKGLKNKAKTSIYLRELVTATVLTRYFVCSKFCLKTLSVTRGVPLCFYAENGVQFFNCFCAVVVVGFVFAFAQICCKIIRLWHGRTIFKV